MSGLCGKELKTNCIHIMTENQERTNEFMYSQNCVQIRFGRTRKSENSMDELFLVQSGYQSDGDHASAKDANGYCEKAIATQILGSKVICEYIVSIQTPFMFRYCSIRIVKVIWNRFAKGHKKGTCERPSPTRFLSGT